MGVLKAGPAALLLALIAGVGPVAAQELAVTRVRLDSLPQLEDLARRGFEVSGVAEEGGALFALVVATDEQRVQLGLAGLPATAAPAVRAVSAAGNFRDFPAIEATLAALAAAGGPVTVDTIGMSWEGRPLLAAKVGPPDDAPERPNVLFMASHHAREWISTALAMRLLAYLADSLPAVAGGAALLASRDVWVIPVVNPDGYQYTFDADRLWRKNRRPNDDGTFGVDLNRNYPAFWGRDDLGSSAVTTAETYRGPGPGSEAETRAVMAFHALHPPATSVSYHSYTDLILFPYGFESGRLAADQEAFTALAGTPLVPAIVDRLPETSRAAYHPGPAWRLYPTNGEYTEWAYRTHGALAFTVELTAGCCVAGNAYGFQFPDDSASVARVFADNLPFALELLAAAGAAAAPGGVTPLLESMWPELRISGAPGPATVSAQALVGATRLTVTLTGDTLDQGAVRWRWRGALPRATVRSEVTVPALGLAARVVAFEGAEQARSTWTGWARDSGTAPEGEWVWRGASDTLVSGDLSLAGITEPQLIFWTQHGGSLFLPDRFGTVEYSLDRGASWVPVARVEGAGPVWYPVRVPLPAVDALRLRFAAHRLDWRVDAIHLVGTPDSPAIQAAPGEIGVSENPVRSERVYFSWTPAAGAARVSVFTFAGALVHREAFASDGGLASWDVTNGSGERVANGAYLVIVETGGAVLRKRLFVARAP